MRQSTVSLGEMAAAEPAESFRPLAWCSARAPLLAGIALFAALSWPFMRKGQFGEWSCCYLRAAERMQAGELIHRPDEVNAYAYPPAMAMLVMPLAQLPFHCSLAAWYLANVAAMTIFVALAWRLIAKDSLLRLTGSPSHVFWLGLLLASRFLIAPLENQQFDVVIAACLMAGCLALARGRDLAAAIWLGAAAAMKCTPLLFAPYLVWRGKARSAAVLLLVAIGLNRVPDFCWPRSDGQSYLGDWIGTFLLKVGRTAPGVWDSDLVLNQSLAGLVNRLVQLGMPLSTARLPSALTPLSDDTVLSIRVWTYGVALLLLAITAWRFGCFSMRGARNPVRTETATSDATRRTAIEVSALMCLMLSLSPMSSKAHYVVLLLPCLVLARAVVEKHVYGFIWLPPLVLFGPLSAKGITGKPLGDMLLAWGFPTWFALVLLAAMWRLAAHQSPTAPSA